MLYKVTKKLRQSSRWLTGISGSLLLHLLVKQFYHSAGRLPESSRSLWRVAWTVLADTSWAWVSFMTVSRRSFSTLAAIWQWTPSQWDFSDLPLPLPVLLLCLLMIANSCILVKALSYGVFSCSGERWRRMGGGKERKMKGGLAWKMWGKGWNKRFSKQRVLSKIFYQKSSPPNMKMNI